MSERDAADRDTTTRRTFLLASGLTAAGGLVLGAPARAATVRSALAAAATTRAQDVAVADPAPTTNGAITADTIRSAERLAGVTYTEKERGVIAETIGDQIDRALGRRVIELPNGLAPAQTFDPRLAGWRSSVSESRIRRAPDDAGPLPSSDDDIAFAPVTALSRWIERRALTSARLTEIYLKRLARYGPQLECTVTLTPELAREQAAAADRWLDAGHAPRGPLHGIPWGAKDLLDTAGIRTTWGAMPYRDRVAESDAAVVRRLAKAGAVLVAKLTLGALAYGDIWFDGKTRNPWNREQGSSGSSAGSAAATAAGLVGFAIGTETLGSIVSPCMRCGATGLRPTFGRVPRTGAMALCWSMDKIGPICRTAEDTIHVLDAIKGADAGDPSSVDEPLHFDAAGADRPERAGHEPRRKRRVGYDPKWFEGDGARAIDRAALEALRATGVHLEKIELPDWPYDTLLTILFAEAASAFETLTLDGRDDELVWQEPQAWPNTFRRSRFIPAIEYIQADRFRRQVMTMMAKQFADLDAIISPSYAASLLLITNCTGHPSLTIRCGFKEDDTPHGITLWGRLFDEGTLVNIGAALERRLGVWDARPALG